MQQLFLIGYMGSGKSTLGKALAAYYSKPFIDLDAWIEQKEGCSLSEIFSTKGEVYFRTKEHEYLQKIINSQSPKIISLGGGTPCYHNNMELLLSASNTQIIYLSATAKFLSKRLYKEKNKRPLISHIESENSMQKFIGKHLFERLSYYQKANLILEVENKTIEALVQSIVS